MRKLIKMLQAGEKQNLSNDHLNGPIQESPGKKAGIYKRCKKRIYQYFYPEGTPNTPENEKSEEITAKLIEEQILQKKFQRASKNLIILEYNIYGLIDDQQHEEKIQELESLYEKLDIEVFQVIKDSIQTTEKDLLVQAVMAIIEQEEEDHRYIEGNNGMEANTKRPREWRKKWESYAKLSVVDRMNNIPEYSANESRSSLANTFTYLGKTCKTDLIHVVKHLRPHYPEEFDVCNTYAQHYHQSLKAQMSIAEDFVLGGNDIQLLLCWTHNLYPNQILKDANLVGHIDEAKLGSLLPAEKIRDFENSYLPLEVESAREYMNKSLNLEVERWKNGKEPLNLGGCYHSELNIDVIQSYNGVLSRVAEIRPELCKKITPLLAKELEGFLKRYKICFEEYKEKNKQQQFFKATVIANVNCCRRFRDYINGKDKQLEENIRENMDSILIEFENLGHDLLLQDLFEELKFHFKSISQGSSPWSHKDMCEIMKITEKHVSPITTLMRPCHENMMGKLHKHLVKEYVTRLLKKKVSHKSAKDLQSLSKQTDENAYLINEFCTNNGSNATWLNPLIHKLAEIIRLQDLCAIQLEVATLAADFSDITKKHIEALLYIKGNLSRQEIKSIVAILTTTERNNINPPFFSLIKAS
ncbi:tumor necrosis factor alpha-induced protein 2-like [Discoglossus pictus]